MKYFVLLVLLSTLFTSCSTFKEPEFKEVTNIKMEKARMDTSTLSAVVTFNNPNRVGFSITSATGDVLLDSTYIGHFDMVQNVRAQPKSDFQVPVIFKVLSATLLKSGAKNLLRNEIPLTIHGEAWGKKAGISMKIPINLTTQVKPTQLF